MRCNRVEGYSQGTYNCIVEKALSTDWGGTGECVKAHTYLPNKELYYFYRDKQPSVGDMVESIKSGDSRQGGFNVAMPPACADSVKECYEEFGG